MITNLFLQKLEKDKSKLGKINTTHQTNLGLSIITLSIDKLEETSFPHNIAYVTEVEPIEVDIVLNAWVGYIMD